MDCGRLLEVSFLRPVSVSLCNNFETDRALSNMGCSCATLALLLSSVILCAGFGLAETLLTLPCIAIK